jgi:hypothetical protein
MQKTATWAGQPSAELLLLGISSLSSKSKNLTRLKKGKKTVELIWFVDWNFDTRILGLGRGKRVLEIGCVQNIIRVT